MNATPKTAESTTRTVPTTLESTQAKLVYLYLEGVRETTVDAIASALGLRKLALFSVLSTLEAKGYVERDGTQTVRFAA